MKLVNIQIVDNTGHSEFNDTIKDAVSRIVEAVKSNKLWVYLNDNPYFFEAGDPTKADEIQMAEILTKADQPTATLTGELVGGAPKARRKLTGQIISKPISSVLKGKTRAQLVVSLGRDKGVETVKVIASNYNGSRKKLQKRRDDIVAGIVQVLRADSELKREAKAQSK